MLLGGWSIDHKRDQWVVPDEFNIIQGESVEIPINYDGPTDDIPHFNLSFKKIDAS